MDNLIPKAPVTTPEMKLFSTLCVLDAKHTTCLKLKPPLPEFILIRSTLNSFNSPRDHSFAKQHLRNILRPNSNRNIPGCLSTQAASNSLKG